MLNNTGLRIAKNTGALFIGRASVMLFSFVFFIFAARLLGVDGIGTYALALGYFELFLSMSATGMSILIIRELAKRPSWINIYLSSSGAIVTVLALMASLILVILVKLSNYAPDTRLSIYLVCLALLPASISLLLESTFVALEKAEYVTYGTVMENILRVGISLIVLFNGYGVPAFFAVLIFTRFCMLLFYFAFLSRQVSNLHLHFDWAFLKQLIHDWRVFALENWLSNLFIRLDIILLSFFHGEFVVGLYAVAQKILRLGIIASTSYTTAIFPYMSRLFEESRYAFRRLSEGSLKYMLALVLPGVVIISFLADRVILLLFGVEFAGSIPILRVLIWVLPLFFFNKFMSYVLFARGEQSKSLKVAAIRLTFYVAISLRFISEWGGIGAAWAFLMAMCVAFCLYFVFVSKGEGMMPTLQTFGRTGLAAISLFAILLVFKDVHLIPLLISAVIVYFLLLFILRVPSLSDFDIFRGQG